MKHTQIIPQRIYTLPEMKEQITRWRLISKSIAFTNGVFDILHEGHIALLAEAATHADMLIVALNSDASVKRLKGDSRPVNKEQSRALVMASLLMVDAVILFEEDTPFQLIEELKPDVLIKGGDYTLDTIVGAKETLSRQGRVEIIPLKEGFSTTSIIQKIESAKK